MVHSKEFACNAGDLLETWVRFLGWEDPLEKEMATLPSILTWGIPCTKEPDGLQSIGLQRVRQEPNNIIQRIKVDFM